MVARSLKKCFPAEMMAGVQIPFVEDLVNHSTFTGYHAFLLEGDIQDQQAYAPSRKGHRWAAAGFQPGVLDQSTALPPLFGTCKKKKGHGKPDGWRLASTVRARALTLESLFANTKTWGN